MEENIILKNDNIKVTDGFYHYKIQTYDYNDKINGEVLLSKQDIERLYFAMKLNEANK